MQLCGRRCAALLCKLGAGLQNPDAITFSLQELSQWRQQRAEEALKASVLDEEAAAQFSTAAALAQKEKEKAAERRSNQAAMAGADPHPVRPASAGPAVQVLHRCQPLHVRC